MKSLVSAYVEFGDLETAEKLVQAMREQRRDICWVLREFTNLEYSSGNESDYYSNNDEDEDCVFEKLLPNLVDQSGNQAEPPLLPKGCLNRSAKERNGGERR
ncbi:hypothetical protein VNO80_06855 [Phaseolus coccineus]|uniref:Pentatricopeptide repeat-containing protein n=1 Tax=Phaseolus coccineus TaxID=3886 RepID=A0AAN9NPI2_PHACN